MTDLRHLICRIPPRHHPTTQRGWWWRKVRGHAPLLLHPRWRRWRTAVQHEETAPVGSLECRSLRGVR